MKTVRLFAFFIIAIGIFAVSAIAQTASPTKIAVINTEAFYVQEKGIRKIAAEYKKLELEFAPSKTQLEALGERLTKLQNELKGMQENRAVPFDQSVYNTKVAEYEKLGRELKFKNDEHNLSVETRENQLMEPIRKDIGLRISEFAKQKGFDLVLNSAQLAQAGALLHLNEAMDITDAFIIYYNALPARTASVNN